MKGFLVLAGLVGCIVLGFIFESEPFIFKFGIFLLIFTPIFIVMLFGILQDFETRIKKLENKIQEMEN